jgi:hypothetical protein
LFLVTFIFFQFVTSFTSVVFSNLLIAMFALLSIVYHRAFSSHAARNFILCRGCTANYTARLPDKPPSSGAGTAPHIQLYLANRGIFSAGFSVPGRQQKTAGAHHQRPFKRFYSISGIRRGQAAGSLTRRCSRLMAISKFC